MFVPASGGHYKLLRYQYFMLGFRSTAPTTDFRPVNHEAAIVVEDAETPFQRDAVKLQQQLMQYQQELAKKESELLDKSIRASWR